MQGLRHNSFLHLLIKLIAHLAWSIWPPGGDVAEGLASLALESSAGCEKLHAMARTLPKMGKWNPQVAHAVPKKGCSAARVLEQLWRYFGS